LVKFLPEKDISLPGKSNKKRRTDREDKTNLESLKKQNNRW